MKTEIEETTDLSDIKGWNIDSDPENEPTYPMKKYTGDDHERINWERPPLQPVTVEILHSNERPNITAVFGTSVPPFGLSGKIRRYAFRYSENRYRHWLPLLLADRINVLEGLADDLKKGYVPNLFAEWGLKSEWKYNKIGLAKKILTRAAVAFVLFSILTGKSKSEKTAKPV